MMLWSTNVLGCVPSYLMGSLGHRLDMPKGHEADTTAWTLKLEVVPCRTSAGNVPRRTHVFSVLSHRTTGQEPQVLILESRVVHLR